MSDFQYILFVAIAMVRFFENRKGINHIISQYAPQDNLLLAPAHHLNTINKRQSKIFLNDIELSKKKCIIIYQKHLAVVRKNRL